MTLEDYYRCMFQIRVFEENVLELFSQGKLFGTTHAYIGQEANAVGVISNLEKDDIVVSNHRCHGHYLVHKQNPFALLSEMMGKADGLCSGRGGSQHICDESFYSNGIQGGIMPLAAGLAYAEKMLESNRIVTVFIGDGTLGEGVVYEVLNIASKWKLPLLIVVENNRYAQSTKIEFTMAGSISGRFSAFDIDSRELDTFDVLEVSRSSGELINKVRLSCKPSCLIINTYRFASHSKSDDARDKAEIQEWKNKDPLKLVSKQLDRKVREKIESEVTNYINEEITRALSAPIEL